MVHLKLRRSGVSEGVFQTVVLDGVLINSEDVNAVTFTGSVFAGGKGAQRARSQIKKCVGKRMGECSSTS